MVGAGPAIEPWSVMRHKDRPHGNFLSGYDERHSDVLKQKSSPIEVLKYLMDEHGMNTISLDKLVGGPGQASLILSGKRELSKANIRTLAARFNVSPAVFI